MIDIKLVEKSLKEMGDFENGFEQKYSSLIKASANAVFEILKDGVDQNDPRVIQFAAAKAFFTITNSASFSDGVTSFSANGISITEKQDFAKNAKEILQIGFPVCIVTLLMYIFVGYPLAKILLV